MDKYGLGICGKKLEKLKFENDKSSKRGQQTQTQVEPPSKIILRTENHLCPVLGTRSKKPGVFGVFHPGESIPPVFVG